jgi:hypothetical protein
MRVTKQLSFFFILLLAPMVLLAQAKSKPGFVILNSNDTIRGIISFINEGKIGEELRVSLNEKTIDLKPNEVLGVGIDGDKFYSTQIIENLLVEVVVEGLVSLYRHNNEFYVKKIGYNLHKLEPEIVDGDKSLQVRKNTRWKGIFNLWCNDCPSSVSAIASLQAKEKELIAFIVNYNRCVNAEYNEFRAEKKWFTFKAGLYFGFSQTQINSKFSETVFPYLSRKYTSADPTLGILFAFSSPRISDRVSFQTELIYNAAKYYSFIEVQKYNRVQYFQTDITLISLSLPLSIGYKLLEGKWETTLFAGISPSYNFNSNATLFSEEVENNLVTSYLSNAFNILAIDIGPRGGAVIKRDFNLFSAGIILSFQSNAIDNTFELSSMLNRFSVSILIQNK